MSYPERLEDAGISWQIYQNQEHDFYALNPLLGFRAYREAHAASVPTVSATRTPRQQALYEKGIRTRDLDLLRADVIGGRLPKVSWICPTASGCEHPDSSSPAQGAAYIAQVLDALTADAAVWARTALIVNFDENDGLFDHVPPPAPPSYVSWDADPAKAVLAGASTVDIRDEYLGDDNGGVSSVDPYRHRPWGLGPRVPLFVISPWSKGGWVNSQIFDQTSTIRFVEARFGVREPNISPWRRAVTGDLTSCFDFATPDDGDALHGLPDTSRRNAQSRALGKTVRPAPSATPNLPNQAEGTRRSRPLPYALQVQAEVIRAGAPAAVQLHFSNDGTAAAVVHVYDRLHLDRIPHRYTIEAGKRTTRTWPTNADGAYDLWVLGPNGLHRHYTGIASETATKAEITLAEDRIAVALRLTLRNGGTLSSRFVLSANAYRAPTPTPYDLPASAELAVLLPLASHGWYDFSITLPALPGWSRRIAGRLETGKASISDPAMHGPALATQWRTNSIAERHD
jgi:phospholipase C